jgi:hypothetical protein
MPSPGSQKISRMTFGSEKQPVIVIDDFVSDPDLLIGDASMLSFQQLGEHYPGVRATVAPFLVSRFLNDLMGLIADTFAITAQPIDVQCWYSLVTTPPEALEPIQRLPHFDSVDGGRIALLHYLSREEKGGTSFYRHRATGFESVSAERLAPYSASIEADIARHGLPDPAYISGDTDIFEHIAHYEGRFNRAIIYRGNTLHCADIPSGITLSADPQAGRLTVNTFIHGRPAAVGC